MEKIVANVLNLKVDVIETEEGPAFGAAMLAAVGCAAYSDVETVAQKIVKVIDIIEPDPALLGKYEERYRIFRSIYPVVQLLYQNYI